MMTVDVTCKICKKRAKSRFKLRQWSITDFGFAPDGVIETPTGWTPVPGGYMCDEHED